MTATLEATQWPDIETWGWNANFTPTNLTGVAAASVGLLQHEHRWINRRVETIHLIDEQRLRVQVSIDFRLPERLPGAILLGDQMTYFVPLMFLSRKTGPSYVDVRDEAGASVPLLTSEDNGMLTGHVLLAAAETVLGEKRATLAEVDRAGFVLSPEAQTYLQGIPTRPEMSKDFLRAILDRDDKTLYPDRRAPDALLGDPGFRRLLAVAATSSAIHVPLTSEPGRRRVIKLSWEQRWSRRNRDGRRDEGRIRRTALTIASGMGWRPHTSWLERPYFGGGVPHHVQISVPAHVAMLDAGIATVDLADVVESRARIKPPKTVKAKPVVSTQPRFTRSTRLSLGGVPHAREGLLWIRLRASRRGFLPGACLTALYVTILLTLYWRNAHDIRPEAETAAAVLLLVPALIASWLVQPSEHEMARRLLRVPRYVTTVVAGLPLMGVSLMVAVSDPDPPGMVTFLTGMPRQVDWKFVVGWLVLALVALISTILLLLSWRYPRPLPINARVPPNEYPTTPIDGS